MVQLSNNEDKHKHWQIKKFDDLLDYIQPTSFIVESTEYSDKYKTPVLTAGKSFVLGNTNEDHGIFNSLPVIIFDDFTTAIKFVNFPFKVKSSAMKILSPKNKFVNIKFVFYFMQTIHLCIDTHKRYWISEYSKLNIPLPPLSEQNSIVSKIEELFSELENAKQQLLTTQQQLKVYRQSILKWAFEKIVEKEIVAVDDCCTHIVDCLHSTAKFADTGYYCVDTTCIENGRIIFDRIRFVDKKTYHERIARLKPQEGDILFSREGTVGTTLIVPKNIELCLGQRMMMFRVKVEITPEYFMYYFLSPFFKSQYQPLIMGTTAPHLNIRDVKKFKVIICPIKEQKRIVDELESKLTVCDKIEETISQSLLQAETLRQSILKQAFEGSLV